MSKQMSGKTFSNLLEYYITCLEQEDMLSVTFEFSSEGTRFISTPLENEMLFYQNKQQVIIEHSEKIKRFFQASLLQQKNKSLFYGYPIVVSPGGIVSPLFFTEIHIEAKEMEIVFTTDLVQPTMNHYLLTQQGFSSEEIMNIQQDGEEEFPSALASICNLLHLDSTPCSPILDKKPLMRTITPKVINKAILYFGERTDITHNLIVELHQLKKKPLDDLASSSLIFLLTGELSSVPAYLSNKPLLEIFLLNPSQEHAVQSALTKPLTIITGPPGTGKSQVVLNIISNAVYQNKTVLFASKNNKAVDVVIEKLNALLPQKLIVRMGHQAHRRNAKTELEQLLKQHISRTKKNYSEETTSDLLTITSEIKALQNILTGLSALNQSIENTQNTIDSLRKQLTSEFFEQWNGTSLEMIEYWTLKHDIEIFFEHHNLLRKFEKTITPERYKKNQNHCFQIYYNNLPSSLKTYLLKTVTNESEMRSALQSILRCRQIELAHEELFSLKNKLLSFPSFTDLKHQLLTLHEKRIAHSRPLFEQYWLDKFERTTNEEKQNVITYLTVSKQLESWVGDQTVFRQLLSEQLWTFQKSLHFLPVWVVTNLSAKRSFPFKNNLFDLLIIDEASQCDVASALPLFYRAKHVVIIGDPHQLKHISLLSDTQDRTLAVKHHLNEEVFSDFSYTRHSLYDLVQRIGVENNEHPILLNEHYRCHPDIISFSNEYYYGQKLTIATDEKKLLHNPFTKTRVIWHHIKGKTIHTKSPYNEQEAETVVEEILKLLGTIGDTQSSNITIGIVTLFRAQTEIITEKLNTFQPIFKTPIVIGTAHRFQGDEKDIIVFSPAVSDGVKPGTLHWIQTTSQLLNVAVTRARSLLIIVGDQDICSQTTGPLKDLVEYVETRNITSGVLDSPSKQLLYTELIKNDIAVTPGYCVKGSSPSYLDFVLFINGCKYVLELDGEHQNVSLIDQKLTRDIQLRTEGWRFRRLKEQDIHNNIQGVIEEIKRLC